MAVGALRLRVGDTTLCVRYRRELPALRLPAAYRPFVARRGNDIVLDVVEGPVPVPDTSPIFESGGTWQAFETGSRILYAIRSPDAEGPPARGLTVDRRRRRGVLYLAPSAYVKSRGFALMFPLDELLFQHHVAHAGGLVLHACGVATRGGLVAFAGHSGAGKSTTGALWRRFARGSNVLSDDRLVLRSRRGRWWGFGTPWHGSGRQASPDGRPLRAIVLLRQSRVTRLRRLDTTDLASRLLPFTFPPPWEGETFLKVLRSCRRLVEAVACYELAFRPDRTAVDAVRNALGL